MCFSEFFLSLCIIIHHAITYMLFAEISVNFRKVPRFPTPVCANLLLALQGADVLSKQC